ncbi:hypothetical protein AYX14_00019 [Cryptococcus neoformans]|nr:hypothetical protein AYX15_05299 [Cryptococcus neoformans var. grubii]OWZ74372.1 hypothetical protein AYX14_00019 [Cryptococcus neoformans var. grubii]OWZ81068.1 hypothetical protein C365_00035 [Cryptococcus neoformans var. grubii Bt85]OXM81927.1 hypothetical protein C364_00034 [Cryptococcus neoformans var. grubii Bt63]
MRASGRKGKIEWRRRRRYTAIWSMVVVHDCGKQLPVHRRHWSHLSGFEVREFCTADDYCSKLAPSHLPFSGLNYQERRCEKK